MILLAIAIILAAADFSSDAYWSEGIGGKRYAEFIHTTPKQTPVFRIGLWAETGKFFVFRWEGDQQRLFRFHQEGTAALGIKVGFNF
jgi:hypothetical protein